METLINALYVYAQENRVSRRLQTLEYRQAVAGIEEGWNAFKATLTAEQGTKLAALLSGISIGLDLGRL